MTIIATVTGRLIADPVRRIGSGGAVITFAMIASAFDGDTVVCVIAHDGVAEQLAGMAEGDKLAVAGHATIDTWTGCSGAVHAGLSLSASALLPLPRAEAQAASGRP